MALRVQARSILLGFMDTRWVSTQMLQEWITFGSMNTRARAPTRTNECLLNRFRGYGSMVHTEKCNTGLNIITNTLPSFRGREENQAHFFVWILTRHTPRAVPRASQRGRHHWQREEIDSFSKLETSSARRKWIGDGVGDGLACKLLTRACLLTGHAVQSRFRVTVEFWSNQLKKKKWWVVLKDTLTALIHTSGFQLKWRITLLQISLRPYGV